MLPKLSIRTAKQSAITLQYKPLRASRSTSTNILATQEDEYTATPQYPPIIDVSPAAKRERIKEGDRDQIKSVKTVEEKQIKLNMPKYYGFKTYLLPEENINYNNLHLIQHCTRTHLIEDKKLPKFYDDLNVNDIDIKSAVEEVVALEMDGYRKTYDIRKEDLSEVEKDNLTSNTLSKQINRLILNKLSKTHKHLIDVQVDFDARIESTWVVGGMDPPENIKRCRRGLDWLKPTENESTDRVMKYCGTPNLTLRSTLPLPPIVSYSEAENSEFRVPFFKYDPRVVDTKTDYLRMANIPGFWPGDPYEFGIVQYNKRGHLFRRAFKDPQDNQNLIHGQGILACFGWLSAQANFLGFNTYNEITYPLVTQAVITNGKLWSFYIYQLNTLLMHSKNTSENPKRNICWATPELKLYEEVTNGKLVGLNEEVLQMLLKLYINAPKERLGVNLKPYLSQGEKLSADYADAEKREWLEREYKFLVSGRPRHHLPYEIYHWEKIYKIDHETRFMEPRRRPFELFEKPYNRKLNERKPKYIPRVLRPHLPKNKGRDAKEFFP